MTSVANQKNHQSEQSELTEEQKLSTCFHNFHLVYIKLAQSMKYNLAICTNIIIFSVEVLFIVGKVDFNNSSGLKFEFVY